MTTARVPQDPHRKVRYPFGRRTLSGEAFVGCLAHNNLPFRLRPGLPIYADDLEKVKESWHMLMARGAKMIYPAHGDPFSVDVMKRRLAD